MSTPDMTRLVVSKSPAVRGATAYLFLAFGMAWIPWSIAWLGGVTPANLVGFQLALLPGVFAPAASAWIVRKWITHEGFVDAGLTVRLSYWRYYLFALLSPLIVALVIVALAVGLGVSEPDFSLQRALRALSLDVGPAFSAASWFWLALPLGLLGQSILVTPLLWGEEFGWRGYLQVRLFARRPLLAAVTTGLIWGVWHYPVILMGYQYPDHPVLGLLTFPVTTIFLSIIFGWLRLKTGSVWSASLAHAATNAAGGSLIVLLFWGGPNWILVAYVGVLGWVPLAALCAWILLTGRLQLREP